jgi:hypothetical protein
MGKVSPKVAVALMAILGSLRGQAWASEAGKVEGLIRHANELRRDGRDGDALPLLKQAYELGRSPRTSAQLGLVELALGYWVDADQHLTEALAAANHPWVDRNRDVLATSRAKARNHIATLTIDGRPPGAEVRVNDSPSGNLPLERPIRVPEGNVVVRVSAAGYRPEGRTVNVVGGDVQRLSFSLPPISDLITGTGGSRPGVRTASSPEIVGRVNAKASPSDEIGPTWRRALPWALLTATVAASGFGVWQHLRWQQTVREFDGIPACGSSQPQRGMNGQCGTLYDHFASQRRNAFLGYAVAGILGAGAAGTFLWNANDIPSHSARASAFTVTYQRWF